jgi:hypothetical protein
MSKKVAMSLQPWAQVEYKSQERQDNGHHKATQRDESASESVSGVPVACGVCELVIGCTVGKEFR